MAEQTERTDFITINGPTVTILQPEATGKMSDILYSVQLTSGAIVTSPDSFPETAESDAQ